MESHTKACGGYWPQSQGQAHMARLSSSRLGAGQLQGDSWLSGCGGKMQGCPYVFSCLTDHGSLGVKPLPSHCCPHPGSPSAVRAILSLLLHQEELYISGWSCNFRGGERGPGGHGHLTQSTALGSRCLKHWMPFQRNWIWVPAPTWWTTTTCESSSWGSNAPFRPLQGPGT